MINSKQLICGLLLFPICYAHAETDWVAITMDNDIFVGNDNGYTNGLYVSWFDIGSKDNNTPEPDFWVNPLLWTLPNHTPDGAVNAYMIGQAMNTPSDITIANPSLDELPYSAILMFSNSYTAVTASHADHISTTLGVVGPAALGEETQKAVHSLVSADQPKGWDTQLHDEIVFKFSRGHTRRNWASQNQHFDLLTSYELGIGTIQSNAEVGATLRYGRELISSYATTLLSDSRITNPSATGRGWYFYSSLHIGYIFNQIFTDGNTYRDSRSIAYDREYISLSNGLTFAHHNFSISIAVNNANIIQSDEKSKALKNLTRYGTFTVTFKL